MSDITKNIREEASRLLEAYPYWQHNIDLEGTISILEQSGKEIERLRKFITRYRYRIKGDEPMQKYINELLGESDE